MHRTIILSLIVLSVLLHAARAQVFTRYPVVLRPLEETVNSPADDYAPVVTGNQRTLVFTSYRDEDSRGEADVFYAQRMRQAWQQAVNLGEGINTEENDGAVSFAGDGRTAVFAADEREDGLGDTDIYLCTIAGNAVSNVRHLPAGVNSEYWDSQPCISADGRTIYFISNRPGGVGETDIYMTRLQADGSWAPAIPLMPPINTAGSERSPYVTPDGGTLYFASDGIDGYGGLDIFMSVNDGENWSEPRNLGPVINSDADELFFFAPSREDKFYVASSREGGYGGLDIYEGTPNIYGSGMFRLFVSVLDSTTHKPLPSIVTITDLATNTVVTSFVTNSYVAEYIELLPADRDYEVKAEIRRHGTKTSNVMNTYPNTDRRAELFFGSITVAEFDLGKYNVPFFVTGYYRPNTPDELDRLLKLLRGPLAKARYIERFRRNSRRHDQYRAYAQTVESIFRTVYTAGVEEIFPRFKASNLPNEALVITVTGYADPQPIIGRYIEDKTVEFDDLQGKRHVVSKGDVMDNLKLSGLRAHYAAHYLDELFTRAADEGFPEYVELKKAGKIRYHIIGGDVSNDNANYAVQRRIHILISRAGAEGKTGTELDLNEDYK